jgi:hypothetical protein
LRSAISSILTKASEMLRVRRPVGHTGLYDAAGGPHEVGQWRTGQFARLCDEQAVKTFGYQLARRAPAPSGLGLGSPVEFVG